MRIRPVVWRAETKGNVICVTQDGTTKYGLNASYTLYIEMISMYANVVTSTVSHRK